MNIPSRIACSFTLCACLASAAAAGTETSAVLGFWRTPSRAVVRIASCGAKLCLDLVKLSPGNYPKTDSRNPDPALRGRPLCGLLIGSGFNPTDLRHANGGHIYDPKSGRTYSATMTVDGNVLKLRAYIGFSVFGQTVTWVRTEAAPGTCTG